ncbi:MAG: tetratricopeptide repeat protein [Sulfuricella sp.]|nr:tetratricopeptide repeat protein [Sulfuricella sp.]
MPAPTTLTLADAIGLAIQHYQAGRLDEAESTFRQVLQVDADNPNALHLLGILCVQKGDPAAAVELIGKAVKRYPHIPDFHGNLGAAWHALGRFDAAIECYEKALAIKPGFPEAAYNLGNALKDMGRFTEAVGLYRRALALKSDYADAHNNLGMVLQTLGNPVEAIAHFQQALALKPNYAEACNNLGNAQRDQGRLDEAVVSYRQALHIRPNFSEAHGNLLFTLNAISDVSPASVFQEHRNFEQNFAAPFAVTWQPHANPRDPARRLKIGYVSADFREHPVAKFFEPVLAGRDSGAFEVTCYYNRPFGDATTARLQGLSDQWRDISGLSDDQAASLIRADGIDILVDLAGHTAANRILVFARKPAPLQVAWLGYPNTSGLSAMDYRICDEFTDPVGMTEKYHSETLVRLPQGFLCFVPPPESPEVRVAPGLEKNWVTFGSFNNFAKVTPQVLALWARLLQTVPDSRLLLKHGGLDDAGMAQRLHEQFASHGIAAGRVELLGKTPSYREHLECYGRVDIALDPFPYNGTTTTCEALWMGVPVVTLAGSVHAARVGVSLLRHAGLEGWIANSEEEYLQIAAALAGSPDSLNQLRLGLRSQLLTSPLTDAMNFVASMEAIYREIWQMWCSGG